ncbi:MAG: Hsp20/alpha crystallin family protein [Fimbriimonadales bacterium]
MASKRQDEDWFFRIGEKLERLSDEVMRGVVASSAAARRYWRPNADVCESHDEITVTIELAGVESKNVTLQYIAKTRTLVLRGTRRSVDLPDCQPSRSHQLEVYYGEFEREVRLPEGSVDPSGIRASFTDGMLVVRIPKKRVESTLRITPVEEDNGRS